MSRPGIDISPRCFVPSRRPVVSIFLPQLPRAALFSPRACLPCPRTTTTTASPSRTPPPSLSSATTLARAHTAHRNMATLGGTVKKHKVAIIGSGNWGTTIAKVVAENTQANPDLFERDVQMWVYEEQVTVDQQQQKLTQVINTKHENVKYLPNIPLPTNIVANPDLVDAVRDATILVFNLPHQFIARTCDTLKGHVVPFARGISCIKGVNVTEDKCELFSDTIGHQLGIYCGALSGANIATEVALEKWSETTIAYDPPEMDSRHQTPVGSRRGSESGEHKVGLDSGRVAKPGIKTTKLQALPADYPTLSHSNIKKLFHRPYFHVRMVHDVAGVSLGGALKNVVALAAGWVDGLGWGDNAKAAVMRVGIMEEVKFGKAFFSNSVRTETFTEESCGVADMITSCSGGRNFRCAKVSVQEGKPIDEIEERELNGQKLQGTSTAYEVNAFLKKEGKEQEFPLFTAVYNILEGNKKPQDIPDLIEDRNDE